MRHITSELNSSLKQPEQVNANMRRRPRVLMALAFLALIGAILASSYGRKALAQQAGGQKATGSGGFVNDGVFGSIFELPSYAPSTCTFDFNAQTVDSAGNTKGQLQFEDKTFGVTIHATLTFTDARYGYSVYGPATYSVGGVSMPGSVTLIPSDGNPDYFIVVLFSPYRYQVWSGQVTNGNITIH